MKDAHLQLLFFVNKAIWSKKKWGNILGKLLGIALSNMACIGIISWHMHDT